MRNLHEKNFLNDDHQNFDDPKEVKLQGRPLTSTDIVFDDKSLQRRSAKLSGSSDTMINSTRNPTTLESDKGKILVAISQIGLDKSKPTQTEFSNEETCHPPKTPLASNWRSLIKDKAWQAWSSDISKHARAETWQALTGLKRLTVDSCEEAKQNLWDTRNESERRTIFGSLLLLLLFPFLLPMLTNYIQIILVQSRTVFLSVPELVSGDSDDFFDLSKIRIPFRTSSLPSVSRNTLHLQKVVDKLISDPKFLDLVKPDKSRQRVMDNKFSDLVNKLKTDLEADNLNLSSDVEKLRSNLKNQVNRVVGKIPILSSGIEAQTASSIIKKQNVELRLANLYLELEATRREITNLRMADSQLAQKSDEEPRKVSQLEQQLNSLVAKNRELSSEARDCQIKSKNLVQDVTSIVQDMIGKFEQAQNVTWSKIMESLLNDVRPKYLTEDQLADRLKIMTQKLRRDFELNVDANLEEQVKESLSKKIEDLFENSIRKKISDIVSNSFNKDDVEKIVKEAIKAYDADKTGRFDFALESSGGTIVSTPSTETYEPTRAVISIWGIPIWQVKNSPRQIIESGSDPGQCWAFKGSQGRVIIKLIDEIRISGVTLEHIPASLSPDGSISSAPKNFEIFGLSSAAEPNPDHLGNFAYNTSSWPVQTFHLSSLSNVRYNYLELKVLSNHGNPVYTCIYRFRVHGIK